MRKVMTIGLLTAILAAGCSSSVKIGRIEQNLEIADPPKGSCLCDKALLKDDDYLIQLPSMPAVIYFVRNNATSCGLLMEKEKVIYSDLGCDNTLDFIIVNDFMFSRKSIAKNGENPGVFDHLLGLGQIFVCKENEKKYNSKDKL